MKEYETHHGLTPQPDGFVPYPIKEREHLENNLRQLTERYSDNYKSQRLRGDTVTVWGKATKEKSGRRDEEFI